LPRCRHFRFVLALGGQLVLQVLDVVVGVVLDGWLWRQVLCRR
jgi:hypothetical protein